MPNEIKFRGKDYMDRPLETSTMLDAVKILRIFAIERQDDGFLLYENCDQNYGYKFTKQEIIDLADELKLLANS